ncbi:MAG: diaminopimelate decarboxylase, partial [Planctomycetota bacterium]
GVNLLPTSYWYKHDIQALKDSAFGLEEYHVLGCLCMQIDVIRSAVPLPPLSPGDLLVVRNVGAYNYSQSMTFIQPRPAWLLVSDGRVDVIREGETAEWVRALDRIPARLAPKAPRNGKARRR